MYQISGSVCLLKGFDFFRLLQQTFNTVCNVFCRQGDEDSIFPRGYLLPVSGAVRGDNGLSQYLGLLNGNAFPLKAGGMNI